MRQPCGYHPMNNERHIEHIRRESGRIGKGGTYFSPAAVLRDGTCLAAGSCESHVMVNPSDWLDLVPPHVIRKLIDDYLAEDVHMSEVGGFVVGSEVKEAWLLCKSPCKLAGRPFFDAVFAHFGACTVTWHVQEGDGFPTASDKKRVHCATVRGPANQILLGERIALNILSRCSGVAGRAAHLTSVAKGLHGGGRQAVDKWPHGRVAATRKTTPGFRVVEKYGALVGGADTHRMSLSSMVMIKDNHIWASGGIPQAVAKARQAAGFSVKIEVEVRDLDEALAAAKAGADVIMLDNFTPGTLHPAAEKLKEAYPAVIVEASGGIRVDTIASYAGPHIDVISVGNITHGYSVVDFSLKIQKDK